MLLKHILLVGIGGFAGSVARYLVGRLTHGLQFFDIPVGTLIVNVLGSLILGLLMGIAEKSALMTADLRMLLMVGLCGGFTTFSTFTGENLALMHSGEYLVVFLYTALSLLLGFLAVYLGYILTNLL
ncbi:MAG TPA: fluoride efflux transporter CrcB [Bacteroidales bacterium]|nr:fluoride efflux transporter CrcB [Bacteroidales bacterium]HRZ76030.1 fluoride efflux transporter CrcB [Bacteroidales bacterium]